MLDDVGEVCKEEAQRILALLCFSSRPLLVAEVIEALAVDICDKESYGFDRKLANSDDLLRICPGLIEIQTIKQYNDDFHDFMVDASFVRIAHFSVQEYLLSSRIGRSRATDFALSAVAAHAEISKTCLIYLCNESFINKALTRDLVKDFSLAQYAAKYWHEHYRTCKASVSPELKTWTLRLLMTDSSLKRWVQLYNAGRSFGNGVVYDEDEVECARPPYYAAFLGLDDIVMSTLSSSPDDLNFKGGLYGHALQAASLGGYDSTVQLLLERGADVNAEDGFYGTALIAAATRGHLTTVQILLNDRANIDPSSYYGGNALQEATFFGHEEIVQTLLRAGANANTPAGKMSTALEAAVRWGYKKIVKMLFAAGAVASAKDYGSMLVDASAKGYEEIVRMLLDRGADVNARATNKATALMNASAQGREQTIQILLKAGADANAKRIWRSCDYGTALQAASLNGHEKVVQMLLDAVVDVNAGPEDGYPTALQRASFLGHERIVKMLLDAGADFNARGEDDETALQSASRWGHGGVVRLLLDAGAEQSKSSETDVD